MSTLEMRIAKALVAFRKSEGFSLTEDQYDALIDQMALVCSELAGAGPWRYSHFVDACHDTLFVG